MRTKMVLLALALGAATLTTSAAHADTQLSSCSLSRTTQGTSTCDVYIVGARTDIHFREYSGDASASVSCGLFTVYMETDSDRYSTNALPCHMVLTQWTAGSSYLNVSSGLI